MKYYNVTFTFNIPVAVKDGDDAEVDAYYAARAKFFDYNVNESQIKCNEVSESQYRVAADTEAKLHGKK